MRQSGGMGEKLFWKMVPHRTLLNLFPEASSPQRPCNLRTTQRCSWSGCSRWFFCVQTLLCLLHKWCSLTDQVRVTVMCTPRNLTISSVVVEERERRPAPRRGGQHPAVQGAAEAQGYKLIPPTTEGWWDYCQLKSRNSIRAWEALSSR